MLLKFALKSLARLLALLPVETALSLGRGLGWLFSRVLRYRHAEALESMMRSLGRPEHECRKILHTMYGHLGMNIVETLLCLAGKEQRLFERITYCGEEHLKAALARESGVLVLTGHCGNWELLGMWAGSREEFPPVTILVKQIRQQQINELVLETRARLVDVSVVSQARSSVRQSIRALKRNELVTFLLDQNTIYREGVFVDFFDKLCCTRDGLAGLAARQQTPILPVFIRRTADHRHEVTIHPPIDPPEMRDPHSILEATQHYTKVIEDHIRTHPAQWIWIHRRWRTKVSDIPPHRRDDFILPPGALADAGIPEAERELGIEVVETAE